MKVDTMLQPTNGYGILAILFSTASALIAPLSQVDLGAVVVPAWVLTALAGGMLGWLVQRLLTAFARHLKHKKLLPGWLDDGKE